jgi:nicotinate dehydrogenase subunit B
MNPTTLAPLPASSRSADMNPPTRREFLQRLGAGLMIWVAFDPLYAAEPADAAAKKKAGSRPSVPTDFNAFLSIGADGKVTCFTGKIEMGQGPITSLPQMLAEDLDVPLDRITIVMGDTELCPYDQGTWGSLTTRSFGPLWRAAATEARGVLLELGAEHLKVPVAQLTTRDGLVVDSANPARSVAYGTLTQGKRVERRLTVKPDLKKPAQFKIVGKPLLRRDAREKVTGEARYTGDLRLPGMLYAGVLRPPAHGARLQKADTSAARAIPGVVVVELPNLVAVLHELPDVAEAALDKIKAEFAPSPSTVDDRTLRDHLAKFDAAPRVGANAGDIAQGRTLAARRLDDSYYNPYVAHAAMETHTALAKIEEKKVTVWASTQNPFGARDEIARALDLPATSVRVITPFVGGGFGGKSFNLQAVEAARLAQATGRPVQVMWSREEEFFNDTFRHAAVINIQAGLDDQQRMVLWDYEVRFAPQRGSELLYDVPHHRTTGVDNAKAHPFPTGAWRAPGCNTNAFARESHVSRLAELAGVDPIEFRLRHLKTNTRAHRVLSEAARIWGWKPAVGRSGRGLGVAIGMDTNTYVATIAEVAVDKATGKVTVKRVLCVQEMGLVINPQGAKMQMEGCITMGLGYALTEEIRFKAGALADTNFNTYELPRFSWLPKIETVILNAENTPPQGGGEPAIIVMGGVLANAVYDACGARLRELPLTPERVKKALAAG